MKLLYITPVLFIIWTLLILSIEAFYDEAYVAIIINFIIIGVLIKIAKNYKTMDTYKKLNIIAINIGLLPLVYANLLLTNILLQGNEINESGMAYVIVLIYSPIFYVISLSILMTYRFIREYFGK